MRRLPLFVAVIVALSAAPSLSAQITLKTIRTEDLRLVYYTEDHEYITPHLVGCFENSMRFHRELFDYHPTEEVTVLLQDFDDIGYAGATGVPYNWMSIGIEPFEYVYEVSPTNERINWVMSHELLHVLASDQAAPSDRFFRKLFGGKVRADDRDPVSLLYSYLTAPRKYAPRWYHEGVAVFMETWMSGGFGRTLGGYDEMVFRTMVCDDARFFRLVGLESEGTTTDFHVGQNAYLYGTRFVAYCAYQYGPEKVVEWIKRTEGTKRYYADQFRHVFGKSLGRAWDDWIEFEHAWQQTNLDLIRQYPLTEYRVLSGSALGSVSRAFLDADARKLYTAVLYPNEAAHIAAIDIDTREAEKISKVRAPALFYVTSLLYDDARDQLFYTTDNAKGWRDLSVANVRTGKSKVVLRDCRTGDLAYNKADSSIWGVQHHNGLSSLVRFEEPYKETEYILTLPYGTDVFDLDISPDGQYFTASMIEVSGRRRLIRAPVDLLMVGDTRYEVLFEFSNNTAANFVHSRDGRYLFGTSYYSGVSNVYRYDIERRRMEIITNADTGFFRPVPVSDDSLIVFRYTSEGFVPVMIGIEPIDVLGHSPGAPVAEGEPQPKSEATIRQIRFLGQAIVEEHPVVRDWVLGSPAEVDLDSVTIEAGKYHAFRNVKLNSVYPIVHGYRDRVAVGLRMNLMERNGLHVFDVSALYTPNRSLPDDERAHVQATYTLWPWEFSGWYNRSDFYDLFGPTKTSLKGYSLAVKYNGNFFREKPKTLDYTLDVAGFAGLDRLPQSQNVRVIFDQYLSGRASLSYSNLEGTIGGLGKERGVSCQLNGLINWVDPQNADTVVSVDRTKHNYPRLWLNLDLGFRVPWDHSSIWLRSSAGAAFAGRATVPEPLNNFYFGGFGNNWVDHGSVKRYREFYAFPGAELNEVSGTNYGKLMLEWVLPPLRFCDLGMPTFYANWGQMAFFVTGLATNIDDRSLRRELLDVGVQLDVKLVSFFSLPYTLSFGYAAAFEESARYSNESMISLKIF